MAQVKAHRRRTKTGRVAYVKQYHTKRVVSGEADYGKMSEQEIAHFLKDQEGRIRNIIKGKWKYGKVPSDVKQDLIEAGRLGVHKAMQGFKGKKMNEELFNRRLKGYISSFVDDTIHKYRSQGRAFTMSTARERALRKYQASRSKLGYTATPESLAKEMNLKKGDVYPSSEKHSTLFAERNEPLPVDNWVSDKDKERFEKAKGQFLLKKKKADVDYEKKAKGVEVWLSDFTIDPRFKRAEERHLEAIGEQLETKKNEYLDAERDSMIQKNQNQIMFDKERMSLLGEAMIGGEEDIARNENKISSLRAAMMKKNKEADVKVNKLDQELQDVEDAYDRQSEIIHNPRAVADMELETLATQRDLAIDKAEEEMRKEVGGIVREGVKGWVATFEEAMTGESIEVASTREYFEKDPTLREEANKFLREGSANPEQIFMMKEDLRSIVGQLKRFIRTLPRGEGEVLGFMLGVHPKSTEVQPKGEPVVEVKEVGTFGSPVADDATLAKHVKIKMPGKDTFYSPKMLQWKVLPKIKKTLRTKLANSDFKGAVGRYLKLMGKYRERGLWKAHKIS